MSERPVCVRCPCPEHCLRRPADCEMAGRADPIPRELRHICESARWWRERGATTASQQPTPVMPVAGSWRHPANTSAPRVEIDTPTAAEAMALVAAMKRCMFRNAAGCGCSGARCGLRNGATVSHLDCFACLQRYPE